MLTQRRLTLTQMLMALADSEALVDACQKALVDLRCVDADSEALVDADSDALVDADSDALD